jgi:hypothetical protein
MDEKEWMFLEASEGELEVDGDFRTSLPGPLYTSRSNEGFQKSKPLLKLRHSGNVEFEAQAREIEGLAGY